jgi:hypothetical protein
LNAAMAKANALSQELTDAISKKSMLSKKM